MWRHLPCSSSMVDWDMLHCLFWGEWAWIQMGQQLPAPSPSNAAVARQRQRDAVVLVESAHCHKAASSFSTTSHILFIFPSPPLLTVTRPDAPVNSQWIQREQHRGGERHWKSNDGRGSWCVGKCGEKGDNGRAADIQDWIVMISERNGWKDNFKKILCLFLPVLRRSEAVSIILGHTAVCENTALHSFIYASYCSQFPVKFTVKQSAITEEMNVS